MGNTVTAGSWEGLQEILFADSFNAKIGRYRSNYAFRGVDDAAYDLSTSLNRVCNGFLDLESNLIRNFKKYASTKLSAGNSFWQLVSQAQHHGLPTRLLDWTFSPFVAMHFATANLAMYDADGAIWCVDYVKVHSQLPTSLHNWLVTEDAVAFSTDMLDIAAENFAELKKLEHRGERADSQASGFFLFFEPPSIDERIVNQYALFSVASRPQALFHQWLEQYPDFYRKVIIPKKLKLEIRDKLDQLNMTERVIYPGLDGLCKWLSRHYTPTERILSNKL